MAKRMVYKLNYKTFTRRINELTMAFSDAEKMAKLFAKDLQRFTDRKIRVHYSAFTQTLTFMEYVGGGEYIPLYIGDVLEIIKTYCDEHPEVNEDCSKYEI